MESDRLITVEQLIGEFESNRTWDKQYRLIIQLGKKLAPLSDAEKQAENQVKGCDSIAWLLTENKKGRYFFKMDSNTRVVKGLMMVLTILYQGKTAEEIADININAIFEQLGLLNHLSPSRSNGLLAIVNKIKGVCPVE